MIKRFTKGPKNAIGRLNRIIAETEKLDCLVGDGIIKIVSTVNGKSISLDVNQLQSRMPKLSGGTSKIKWVEIVRGLQYADPEGEPAEGYSRYIARLTTDTTAAWFLNYGDYEVGTAVLNENESFIIRKYTCIVKHNSASYEPGIGEWENVWEVDDEMDLTPISSESETTTDLRLYFPWFKRGILFLSLC